MPVRSLRSAITVSDNSRDEILQASREMLEALIEANDLKETQVIAALFSATNDLDAAAPAEAARRMGWTTVALHCFQEMAVVDALPKCLRVTLLCETNRSQSEMRHRYLRGATQLRPDLTDPDLP